MKGEQVSARELIRRRVFQEAADFRARGATRLHGLVGRTRTEAVLNGTRDQHPPLDRLDPEREFEATVTAFERNGFLLLAGERQLTDLDEEIELVPGPGLIQSPGGHGNMQVAAV